MGKIFFFFQWIWRGRQRKKMICNKQVLRRKEDLNIKCDPEQELTLGK